jgi:hypothetical protein
MHSGSEPRTVDPCSPWTAGASLRGGNEIRTRTVRADAMYRRYCTGIAPHAMRNEKLCGLWQPRRL